MDFQRSALVAPGFFLNAAQDEPSHHRDHEQGHDGELKRHHARHGIRSSRAIGRGCFARVDHLGFHVNAQLLEHRGDVRLHLRGHQRALGLVDDHLERRSIRLLGFSRILGLTGGGQVARSRIAARRCGHGSRLILRTGLPRGGHRRCLVAHRRISARRCGLGLRGHQGLGLRHHRLRFSLLRRHLLFAEICGHDQRAVELAVLKRLVQLLLAANLRPRDRRIFPILRLRSRGDVLDDRIAGVHGSLRSLHALVEREHGERQTLHLHVGHGVEHERHDACHQNAYQQRRHVLSLPEFIEHREPPLRYVDGHLTGPSP